MDITKLAEIRAKCAAHMELVSDLKGSPHDYERWLYAESRKTYELAEKQFASAASLYTSSELAAMGIQA